MKEAAIKFPHKSLAALAIIPMPGHQFTCNMTRKISFSFLLVLCIATAVQAQPSLNEKFPQLGKNTVKEVIAAMTLEEKIWLVMGSEAALKKPKTDIAASNGIIGFTENKVPGAAGTTFAIPRLGIPSIVLADGPAGVRISPTRKDDSLNTYYATAFPVGTLLASTWNPALVTQVGKAFGNEVREYGVDIILAPGNNIQRNPLNGRNFEYYSEDPLVSGKMAAAIINGLQSNGIGTSLKHFAANNHETRRFSTNAEVSERALREIYLKAFQVALKESEPWTVMTSYNKLNGKYTAENAGLTTNILRNEWDYKGLVVTDWGAGKNVVEQIRAGHSLIMPGRYDQVEGLQYALSNKKLDVSILDQRIEKLLELILKTPSFKNTKFSNKPDLKLHAQVSRAAGTEGMVLLKNTNNALPLAKDVHTIATFGNTTFNLITGGTGSGMVNKAYVVSLGHGLTAAGYAVDAQVEKLYTKYVDSVEASRPKPKNPAAGRPQIPELLISDDFILKQAVASDLAIISVGKNAGEGADRDLKVNYHLMEEEISLIKRVSEAFNARGKKTVVVLNIGGVIDLASWQHYSDAILLAWQPGQEGGHAITDILTGKVNPSGKLAITFPEKYTDVSSAKNFPGSPGVDPLNVVYEEGIYTGYRYYDTYGVKPAYPFGYGLSYTTFAVGGLKLSSPTFGKNITATVTVKNTGPVAGKEVVQIYIAAPAKSTDKPAHELRAFAKTKTLKPGESQTLTFTLTGNDLSSYLPEKAAWIAEPGTYTLKAGVSSRDIRQTKTFTLPKEIVTENVSNQVLPTQPITKEWKGAGRGENSDTLANRRFFSSTSFWNQPIGDNPQIHPRSDHFIALMKRECTGPFFKINLEAWTIPVYAVDDATPRFKVKLHHLSEGEKQRWNTSRKTYGHGKEFDSEPVPIPLHAQADPQGDAHLAVVDWKRGIAWDMWGLTKNKDGSWTSNTGMKYSIGGNGIFNPKDFAVKNGESIHFHGPSRAAGVPAIAGLIMYDEVLKGEINHKLACATRVNAYQEHVFPAIWTDGFIIGGIPEGSVIQLDPALDLSKFDLLPGEVVIAKAMQKYGLVVVDIAGANTLYGEGLWAHPGKSWDGKVREIGGGISSIPLEHYRVLKTGTVVKKGDHYTKIMHDKGLW